MRVVTLKDVEHISLGDTPPTPGYTKPGTHRTRQPIIPAGDSESFNCSVVHFSEGAQTGWHVHDCDQLLIVTDGSGYIATNDEQKEINVGDVVHIKAGERHWHGAKVDGTLAHITVTLANSKAVFE